MFYVLKSGKNKQISRVDLTGSDPGRVGSNFFFFFNFSNADRSIGVG